MSDYCLSPCSCDQSSPYIMSSGFGDHSSECIMHKVVCSGCDYETGWYEHKYKAAVDWNRVQSLKREIDSLSKERDSYLLEFAKNSVCVIHEQTQDVIDRLEREVCEMIVSQQKYPDPEISAAFAKVDKGKLYENGFAGVSS